MLGKRMLTPRQIKLENRRLRCDNCQSICKVYDDEEEYGNGKLVRLKCPSCSWISEGKVFIKEFNRLLQNRQRVGRIPEYLAEEKKIKREQDLKDYYPLLALNPMKPNSSNPKTIKETRRARRKLLKKKGLVHATGKVEVIKYY
ncbi:hypothetical protein LCGC14_1653230 [marine sediment metagenome]|uniref:Uncharacterized protein n=1 Tax=marine sediment metagenome TaxID=412755 RepID=A0A0F9HX10_9ZZZZ